MDEQQEEMLLCARYGEVEDMLALIEQGVSVDSVDGSGNTGKSAVTEAFNSQDQEILRIVLEHSSAAGLEQQHQDCQPENSQARQSQTLKSQGGPTLTRQEQSDTHRNSGNSPPSANKIRSISEAKCDDQSNSRHGDDSMSMTPAVQTYTHTMKFRTSGPELYVREIGTEWFGKVFGKCAEEDTTGIQIWAASLIAGWWIVDIEEIFSGKSVLEVGAGCGLPSLCALAYTKASSVTLTDYYSHTIDNLRENVSSNAHVPNISDRASVHAMDWMKPDTWPQDSLGKMKRYDIILGCDLVYDMPLVEPLCNTITTCLAENGEFLYVAGGKRKGAKEFISRLRELGMKCTVENLKDKYKENPLVGIKDSDLELHFNELHENTQTLFRFSWPTQ